MFQASVYKIMVGAPSDITEEIGIVEKTLRDWNAMHSESQNVVLLPLHWSKDTFPAVGKRPQKTINEQMVVKSDLLICIFGTRLGTPTDSFESGSVEEINEHLAAGKPVMIFFRQAIANASSVDPQELARLNEFKAKIGQNALYCDYADSSAFQNIIREKIQHAANQYFINIKSVLLEPNLFPRIELTDYDIERLRAWTSGDKPDSKSLFYEGGSCTHFLGGTKFEVNFGKERVEWDSFFEKLIKKDFINISGRQTDNKPIYTLKQTAYDFVDNLPNNTH